MKRILSVWAIGVLAAASAAAAEADAWRHWRYERPVSAEQGAGEQKPLLIPVDATLSAHAKPDLSDVRLVDGKGREQGYAVLTWHEKAETEEVYIKEGKGSVGAEETVFVAELAQPGPFNELQIVPDNFDFYRAVDIEGSDDKATWTPIRKGMVLYSISGTSQNSVRVWSQMTGETYVGVSHHHLFGEDLRARFPEASYRYVRVRIPHGADKEPVPVSGIYLYRTLRREAVDEAYETRITDRRQNAQDKATELIVDLGMPNLHVNRLIVRTPERRFHRAVQVQAGDDGKTWQDVTTATIFSLEPPETGAPHQRFEIPLPRQRHARYYRLRILNRDSREIAVDDVEAHGTSRFLAVYPSFEGLKLLYGNEDAGAPHYDAPQLFGDLPRGHFFRASTGAETERPAYARPMTVRKWTDERPYLVGVAMVLIAAALLAASYLVLRQAK